MTRRFSGKAGCANCGDDTSSARRQYQRQSPEVRLGKMMKQTMRPLRFRVAETDAERFRYASRIYAAVRTSGEWPLLDAMTDEELAACCGVSMAAVSLLRLALDDIGKLTANPKESVKRWLAANSGVSLFDDS